VNTAPFLHWRMHMLLMGSAAEKVLTGSMSDAALDDIHQFDELATRFLTLGENRTFSAKPVTEAEAAMKAGRINQVRKHVWVRCMAAATANCNVLGELIQLMRKQACLTYGDIGSLLDRVEMPESFPIAQFDTEDTLIRGLIENHETPEVSLDTSGGSMFTTPKTVITEPVAAQEDVVEPVMKDVASQDEAVEPDMELIPRPQHERVTNINDHRKIGQVKF
jgi:hypothetical protein